HAGATTYYIDFETGDNTNIGSSPEAPWKHAPGDPQATDGPAVTKLQPGDVVQFRGGVVYRGGEITIDRGGSPESPIIYQGTGWGEGRAILDGADVYEAEWSPCGGPEDCGGNPHWENIY